MTDSTHWSRKCSTERLNSLLQDADRPIEDAVAGIHLMPDDLKAVRAEKDRRLADSNSPDFRPDFF